MYEVTVVYSAGKGEVMWPGPEIIVMIALGRKKSMQYVLLEAQEAAEQCVIIVVDELSCCWPISRVQTSPDSTTKDSFDAVSIIRRREAPPGAGRVEQFGKHDGSVDSLQRFMPWRRSTLMTCMTAHTCGRCLEHDRSRTACL